MKERIPEKPMFGKYTKAYFIITFMIALSAAAYISYGIFFRKATTKPSEIIRK